MFRKLLWVVPLGLALSSVGSEAKPKDKPPKPIDAPELDMRASGAALALLVGGALVLSERRRRKPERG
jgi:hypothetical protein